MFPHWVYFYYFKRIVYVRQGSGLALSMPFFQTQAEYVCVRAHVLVISPLSSVYTGLTGAEIWAAHHCQQGPEKVGKKTRCAGCRLAVVLAEVIH